MCYHTASPTREKLAITAREQRMFLDIEGYTHYYHVSGFDRPYLPVTLNSTPDRIQLARWKLLPFWVKTEADAKKYANTLNAEGSTIFEKASYKPYIAKNRGLLWVEGFYEPHKVPGVKETENYFIYRPDRELFTLGIVFAPWTDQVTGEHYDTFSIITTDATPQMAEIHNEKKRMPLVIGEEAREHWLNAGSRAEIEALMVPYAGELQAHRTMRVTGARRLDTNVPEVQEPV